MEHSVHSRVRWVRVMIWWIVESVDLVKITKLAHTL
jgi:hypothetical protein